MTKGDKRCKKSVKKHEKVTKSDKKSTILSLFALSTLPATTLAVTEKTEKCGKAHNAALLRCGAGTVESVKSDQKVSKVVKNGTFWSQK